VTVWSRRSRRISTAAGVIVTRVSTDQDVGEQMVGQLFSNPRVMLLAAAVRLLGLVPGMPNLVFLLFTAALLGLAWWMRVAVKPNRQRNLFRSKCRRIIRPSKRPGTTFSWKILWEWKSGIA
jgi:flagellar biosynthesis component FlhA